MGPCGARVRGDACREGARTWRPWGRRSGRRTRTGGRRRERRRWWQRAYTWRSRGMRTPSGWYGTCLRRWRVHWRLRGMRGVAACGWRAPLTVKVVRHREECHPWREVRAAEQHECAVSRRAQRLGRARLGPPHRVGVRLPAQLGNFETRKVTSAPLRGRSPAPPASRACSRSRRPPQTASRPQVARHDAVPMDAGDRDDHHGDAEHHLQQGAGLAACPRQVWPRLLPRARLVQGHWLWLRLGRREPGAVRVLAPLLSSALHVHRRGALPLRLLLHALPRLGRWRQGRATARQPVPLRAPRAV